MNRFGIMLYCLVLVTFMNCTSSKELTEDKVINMSLEEIDEFDSFYRLRGIFNHEPIFIVSYKKSLAVNLTTSVHKWSEIELKKEYLFKVKKLKTRVSTMRQLGKFVIIETDTLWQGTSNAKVPKYFISQNTSGLHISNVQNW